MSIIPHSIHKMEITHIHTLYPGPQDLIIVGIGFFLAFMIKVILDLCHMSSRDPRQKEIYDLTKENYEYDVDSDKNNCQEKVDDKVDFEKLSSSEDDEEQAIKGLEMLRNYKCDVNHNTNTTNTTTTTMKCDKGVRRSKRLSDIEEKKMKEKKKNEVLFVDQMNSSY